MRIYSAGLVFSCGVFTVTWVQEKFKNVMEKEAEIATRLQEIMKNLLSNLKYWGDDERESMIHCLNMMKVYSQDPVMSAQVICIVLLLNSIQFRTVRTHDFVVGCI